MVENIIEQENLVNQDVTFPVAYACYNKDLQTKMCIRDSISVKNPNFCELTGLYWIWKNTNDEYKGLVHYRRYFGKSNLSSKTKDIYTYDEMVDLLKGNDIVLPYVEYFKQNAKEEILIQCCTPEIFDELRRIIEELYPEYLEAFDQYFAQNKSVLFLSLIHI